LMFLILNDLVILSHSILHAKLAPLLHCPRFALINW